MACRQHHELHGAIEKERVGRDQERIGVHLNQPRKCCIDVANGTGIQDRDLLPDDVGGGLNVTHLHLGLMDICGIHERSGRRGMRTQLTQQP